MLLQAAGIFFVSEFVLLIVLVLWFIHSSREEGTEEDQDGGSKVLGQSSFVLAAAYVQSSNVEKKTV